MRGGAPRVGSVALEEEEAIRVLCLRRVRTQGRGPAAHHQEGLRRNGIGGHLDLGRPGSRP